MKKLTILFLLMVFCITSFSQDDKNKSTEEYKTLFGGDHISHGGYGGLTINYTQIDGNDAFLVGARGAWIINHGIGIGLGGHGFVNNITFNNNTDDPSTSQEYALAGGYGGLLLEPIIGAKHPVHISIPILIGVGGVTIVYEGTWGSGYHNYDKEYYSGSSQAFFVVEPGLELELSLLKFFRIGLGAYYRYTSDVSLLLYNYYWPKEINPDLKGFSFGVSLKFGKF